MSSKPNHWIPEICYEENEEGISSNIPFINVPTEEEMPKVVFIFESKETGEFEPDNDGSDCNAPIRVVIPGTAVVKSVRISSLSMAPKWVVEVVV